MHNTIKPIRQKANYHKALEGLIIISKKSLFNRRITVLCSGRKQADDYFMVLTVKAEGIKFFDSL